MPDANDDGPLATDASRRWSTAFFEGRLTMLMQNSWFRFVLAATVAVAGCSSDDDAGDNALRPGVEDSNAAYKGTPNASEAAFWVAVRNGDDAAFTAAVRQLRLDVAADPSNGYSQFLIGAASFMPPSSYLRALAAGEPIGESDDQPDPTVLKEALKNLTDPFYLGFAGSLQASIEFQLGNIEQGSSLYAQAIKDNFAATTFGTVINDIAMGDYALALTDLYALLDFCNRGPVDRNGGDAASYVTQANAAALAQRECYSGYHSAHGTSGLMLVAADLHALTGNAAAAKKYYDAIVTASDYPTWTLKPLIERRRSGAQAASAEALRAISGNCNTCHVDVLR
jgi:hypothetical protein